MVVWPAFEVIIFLLLSLNIRNSSPALSIEGLRISLGVMYWIMLARIIQEAVAQLVEDFSSKNIRNIFTTPVTTIEMVLGLLASAVIKLLAPAITLGIILLCFQQHHLLSFAAVGIGWVLALVVFAGALAIAGIAIVFILGEKASFAGWMISIIIQIFSCVYYDRSVLPTPLNHISYFVPSSYIFEAIPTVLNHRAIEIEIVLKTSLLIFSYYVGAIAFLYSAIKFARTNGILSR